MESFGEPSIFWYRPATSRPSRSVNRDASSLSNDVIELARAAGVVASAPINAVRMASGRVVQGDRMDGSSCAAR